MRDADPPEGPPPDAPAEAREAPVADRLALGASFLAVIVPGLVAAQGSMAAMVALASLGLAGALVVARPQGLGAGGAAAGLPRRAEGPVLVALGIGGVLTTSIPGVALAALIAAAIVPAVAAARRRAHLALHAATAFALLLVTAERGTRFLVPLTLATLTLALVVGHRLAAIDGRTRERRSARGRTAFRPPPEAEMSAARRADPGALALALGALRTAASQALGAVLVGILALAVVPSSLLTPPRRPPAEATPADAARSPGNPPPGARGGAGGTTGGGAVSSQGAPDATDTLRPVGGRPAPRPQRGRGSVGDDPSGDSRGVRESLAPGIDAEGPIAAGRGLEEADGALEQFVAHDSVMGALVGVGASVLRGGFGAVWGASARAPSTLRTQGREWDTRALLASLLLTATLAWLFFGGDVRRRIRRALGRSREAARDEVAFWDEAILLLERHGHVRAPATTPRRFAAGLAKALSAEAARSLGALVTALERVAYGAARLSQSEREILRAEVAHLARALRRREEGP